MGSRPSSAWLEARFGSAPNRCSGSTQNSFLSSRHGPRIDLACSSARFGRSPAQLKACRIAARLGVQLGAELGIGWGIGIRFGLVQDSIRLTSLGMVLGIGSGLGSTWTPGPARGSNNIHFHPQCHFQSFNHAVNLFYLFRTLFTSPRSFFNPRTGGGIYFNPPYGFSQIAKKRRHVAPPNLP